MRPGPRHPIRSDSILWFFSLLILGLFSCSPRNTYLNPAEERFGVLDLVMCDPYRHHWEQRRPEGEEKYLTALHRLDVPELCFRFDSPGLFGGWEKYGDLEDLRISGGALHTRVIGQRARLACGIDSFQTERASQLLLEMSVEGGTKAVFLWRPEGQRYSGRQSKEIPLVADGRFHLYRVQLQQGLLPLLHASGWSGAIDALRLDFPEDAGVVAIRRIELVRGPDREDNLAERLRHGIDDSVTLQQISRPVLPVGTVGRTIRIPAGCTLSTCIGVMRSGWPEASSGKKIHFRILFRPEDDEDRQSRVLYTGSLTPQSRPAHRGWVPVRLPLDQLAGEAGELVFETGVEEGEGVDWGGGWQGAVWGSPRLGVEAGGHARFRDENPPNLVLISLDTLRADRLSCYGHHRLTTPHIDKRLVDRGAQLMAARSSAPWTLPAHASLMTGLDTFHRCFQAAGPLPRDSFTLAEILSDAGYLSAAVTGGGNLGPEWGFHRGFQVYAVQAQLTRAVDDALEYVRSFERAPFFLFFHTYETHAGYTPREPYLSLYEPEPYLGQVEGHLEELLLINREGLTLSDAETRHLKALYDSEIAYTDFFMGRLLSSLDESDLLENTLVILLSDHGEEFNDHGGFEHGRNLYDELLRIPLIFSQPGTIPPGIVSAFPAAMVDVLPTILDLLGLECPAGLSGRSLSAILTGEVGVDSAIGPVVSAAVTNPLYGDRKYALSDGRTKVILHPESGREEYLDLWADPGECGEPIRQPVDAEAAEMMLRLKERLQREGLTESGDPGGSDPPLSEETLTRLKQLGYLE